MIDILNYDDELSVPFMIVFAQQSKSEEFSKDIKNQIEQIYNQSKPVQT